MEAWFSLLSHCKNLGVVSEETLILSGGALKHA